ncbi:hypothetical protein BD626DRAFT_492710 [Schizophyllum amplum]|uniref:Uncharacterized protein n=1 Tax=Schizophyllum amplum TaxID=97359 RepID=A0A550CG55_9AGAR|nr:hypothetical protein BD626DRAFT_492710 [Auriculariopsis ampla]
MSSIDETTTSPSAFERAIAMPLIQMQRDGAVLSPSQKADIQAISSELTMTVDKLDAAIARLTPCRQTWTIKSRPPCLSRIPCVSCLLKLLHNHSNSSGLRQYRRG